MRRNKFSITKRRLKKIATIALNNVLTIALNVFYAKKEKIYPAYDSNYYSNCEVIILMISNLEK